MIRRIKIVLIGVLAVIFLSVTPSHSSWAASDSTTYSYDALGRLTQVTYANGTSIVYAYDAAGNRTSVTVTCGGSGC
jgi:YD repeat-containing protein